MDLMEKLDIAPAELWTTESFESAEICYLVYWFQKPSLLEHSSAVLVSASRQWIPVSHLEIVSDSDPSALRAVKRSFKELLAKTFVGDIKDD